MRTFLLTLTLFSFQSELVFSQQFFQRLLGGADYERAQTAFSTFDNCFIINAATFSFGAGDVDAALIKLDSAGQIIWSKAYGGFGYDNSEYAAETFDHAIICSGRNSLNPGGITSATVFKTDSAGNLLWTRSFGGSANDGFSRIIETADHGYAAIGYSNTLSSGMSDILFIRFDSNGDTLFTRSFGSPDNDAGTAIIELPDSGFLIAGRQSRFNGINPVADGILLRTDASGNLVWSKTYGDSLWEEFTSLRRANDGGYIICGSTTSFGFGGYDILLMKTDSSGIPLWTKTFGGNKSDAAYDLIDNPDSSFVLSGYTESLGYGHSRVDDSTNIFLMKTDANGSLQWMQTYGDGLQDEAFHSNKAADGGYLISGFTTNYLLSDSSQMILIKTDSSGFSGCHEMSVVPLDSTITLPFQIASFNQLSGIASVGLILSESPVNIPNDDACLFSSVSQAGEFPACVVYPNPFNKIIAVHLSDQSDILKVSLTDMTGRIVFVQDVNTRELELNMEKINSGIYVASLFTMHGVFRQRIIKTK